MKGKIGKGLAVMVAVMSLGFTDTKSWQKSTTGIMESQINCILADPDDNHLLYVGTPKALYLSKDQGRRYHSILQVQGSEKAINYLYKPQGDLNIYAATDSGVYVSADQGQDWQNIFNPSEAKARKSFAVFKNGNDLYVGTLSGLYHKYQDNPHWQRESGDLGNTPVYEILSDAQYVYFVNDRRLFRKNKENSELRIIFDAGLTTAEEPVILENEEVFSLRRQIKDFVLTSAGLFMATDKGISYSSDQGQSWTRLPAVGLATNTITSIAVQENFSHGQPVSLDSPPGDFEGGRVIYAGTTNGVLQFVNNRWTPLYKGLETNFIQALAQDTQGTLYAATDKGLFFMPDEKTLASSSHPEPSLLGEGSRDSSIQLSLESVPDEAGIVPIGTPRLRGAQNDTLNFDHEPTIQEVQHLAINYAEVNPNKIKQWRAGAQRRAILPNLSVGLDRSTTELFHWDSGPNPDNLLKGRDFLDWDISLSWDLGDLIWNPDQTSIDSRSKLMVELREDITDQVTRLYFERRRGQGDMLQGLPAHSQNHGAP